MPKRGCVPIFGALRAPLVFSPPIISFPATPLLETRPKFNFLRQNSSDFFFFLSSFFYHHGNLLNQKTTRVGFYIIPLCLGQGLDKWLQKEANTENKMEEKIQLQTPRGFVVCRHFNLCARDQHEIINLTTQS